MLVSLQSLQNQSPIRGAHILKIQTGIEVRDKRRGDYRYYKVRAAIMGDPQHIVEVCLWIPDDQDGVFSVDGICKIPVITGIPAERYWLNRGSLNHIWIKSASEVVCDALKEAFGIALGPQSSSDLAQSWLDGWFRSSECFLQVEPTKRNSIELGRDTVRFETVKNGLSVQERIPKDWQGRIDLLTTPEGSKAGQVYRLCAGASVKSRRITPGPEGQNSIFNDTMRACIVFPENNRPGRILKMRSNFASHEVLTDPEDPRVAHTSYDKHLSGTHLLTAIAHFPENYEDCILIGGSGIEKLTCYRDKIVTVQDTAELKVLVKTGDYVDPGDPLTELKISKRRSYANGIYARSEVQSIEVVPTRIAGKPAWKAKIHLRAIYALDDGCKITTRHGGKGVVRIFDESDMPKTDDGRLIECIVHPKSIYCRRAFGSLREMMANQLPEPIRVNHFSSNWSMKQLISMNLDTRSKLHISGQVTPFAAFVAPLFWIRCDKHSREILSAIGSEKPVNENGRNPNSGKLSGQRMNVGMSTVLIAKGMTKTLHKIIERNVEPEAAKLLTRAMECVE